MSEERCAASVIWSWEGLFTSGSIRNQSLPESATPSEVYTDLKQLNPYGRTQNGVFMNECTIYLS